MPYLIEGTRTLLAGTMHMVPKGEDGWHAEFRRAFDWSQQRVFEMHTHRVRRLCEERTPHGPMPAALHELLAAEWPSQAVGPLQECNVPTAWMIGVGMGMDASPGPEALVAAWAGGTEGIAELETPGEFLAGFADVPAGDFVDSLRWSQQQRPLVRKRFEQMYRAWRADDLAALGELRDADLPASLGRAMFDRRNALWAPRIAAGAKSPARTLVLVGAGHLCGPQGLLALLEREHGLALRPVGPDPLDGWPA